MKNQKIIVVLSILFLLILYGCNINPSDNQPEELLVLTPEPTPVLDKITQIGSLDRELGPAGNAYQMDSKGDYLYLCCGDAGIKIFDITNPGNPEAFAFINIHASAYQIHIVGDYAYVAAGNDGLRILDISSPLFPKVVSSFYTYDYGYFRRVSVQDNYAYIVDSHYGFLILDISDKENPVFTDSFYPGGEMSIGEASVSGNIAYVLAYTDDYSELYILDISEPHNLVIISKLYFDEDFRHFEKEGNRVTLYTKFRGIVFIDVSDPENPDEVANLYGNPNTIKIVGNVLYCGVSDGVEIVNIDDPLHWSPFSQYDIPKGINSFYIKNNFLYASSFTEGFYTFDVANPFHPVLTAQYNTSCQAKNILIQDNLAFISDYTAGLRIIDIADPITPRLISVYDTPGEVYDIYIKDSFAYIADGSNGSCILDISDLQNPAFVAQIQRGQGELHNFSSRISVSGNYAYQVINKNLQIFDISDPFNPHWVSSIDIGYDASEICISGNYVFTSGNDEDIRIIDISSPLTPVLLYQSDSECSYGGKLFIQDQLLFTTCNDLGLVIWDIQNPGEPVVLNHFKLEERVSDICISGDYAYLSTIEYGQYNYQPIQYGIKIIDLSDLSHLSLAGEYDTPNAIGGLQVEDDHIFVINSTAEEILNVFEHIEM